jgi:polyhydroxybutyrate depolymerase
MDGVVLAPVKRSAWLMTTRTAAFALVCLWGCASSPGPQAGPPAVGGAFAGAGAGNNGGGGRASGGAPAAGNGGLGGKVQTGSGGAPGSAGAGKAGMSNDGGALGGGGRSGATSTAGTSAAGAMGSGSAGGATCPVTATAKPGETNESIMVGGMNRTYVLHIPPKYDGKTPLPVIFDYHPLGGTGSSQKSLSGWGTLADDKGIIMVWPDGIGNSWNVGRCCSTAQSQKIDDVAFTKAILTALEKQACIDAKRVYATGCSNGGGMAFKIACDAANVIAAVAPVDFDCVTGAAANPSCGSCMPARPISELQFRGTSDTAVPYAGGSGPAGTLFPGAEENFSEWKDINQCTGSAAPLADHAACSTYPTCEGGVQTVLCTVQNGTHCGNYKSFDIINIAWEMFQKETLP